MKATVCTANLILLVASIGCASVNKHTEIRRVEGEPPANRHAGKQWPFGQHHNPGVRIPARVGAATGALVGVPVLFGLIPITAPIAEAKDSNLFPVVPMLACAIGGENLFGAVAWPFSGWWHLPNHHAGGAVASLDDGGSWPVALQHDPDSSYSALLAADVSLPGPLSSH